MVPVCAPSTIASLMAVTVTVCATFQFALVNVRLPEVLTWLSALIEMSTSALGCAVSTTA